MADHRGEVANREQRGAVGVVAQEGEDVVLGGVRRRPRRSPPGSVSRCHRAGVAGRRVFRSRTRSRTPAVVAARPRTTGSSSHQSGPWRLRPLRALGELLSHEEELLAGVGPHEAEVGAVVGALLPPVAGHLRHQRAACRAPPRRGRSAGRSSRCRRTPSRRSSRGGGTCGAPARAPRSPASRASSPCSTSARSRAAEAARSVVGGAGDAVPGGGLLGDGDDARAAPVDGRVHLLEEGDRVQVLPAAVLVGRPLARPRASSRGRASRRRRPPAARRCGTPRTSTRRWRPGSCAPPCGRSRTPASPSRGARPAAGPRARTAAARRTRPAPSRRAGSGRAPSPSSTPMPGPVQRVDQVPEVVRGAQPGGRRVEAGDLVAPGAAEGVLGDRHQLDMGEAQVLDVRGELLGELAVRQARAARTADGPRRRRTAPRAPGASAAPRHPLRVAATRSARRCTTEAVAGGTSVRRAIGSARSVCEPSGRVISNLYSAPSPTPGTNSSHTPDEPSERIG